MPGAWRGVRRAVLLLVLLGTATIALAGVGCADRLIMPPVPAVGAGDGSPRLMIQRGDGRVLESFRARSPGARDCEPRAFVLRLTSDASTAAQWIADQREIFAAYSGAKRLILQRGAAHVTPLSEDTMNELQDAMNWILLDAE